MTAGGLCRANKSAAKLLEIGGLAKDGGDAFVVDLPGQPIRAKHQQVSGQKSDLGYVGRYRGLSPDGARDDVAQRRMVSLVLSKLAETHLLVDQRMVIGLAR